MATAPHDARPAVHVRRPTRPGGPGPVDELLGLAGGAGFFFIAFLAAIPGLLPAVILVAAPLILLAIPLLAIGIVGGVLFGAGWALMRVARLVRRPRRAWHAPASARR